MSEREREQKEYNKGNYILLLEMHSLIQKNKVHILKIQKYETR